MEAEPSFLDGVIGFAGRAEHAIGDGSQMPTVFLESFSQPVAFLHQQSRPSH